MKRRGELGALWRGLLSSLIRPFFPAAEKGRTTLRIAELL